MAFIHVERETLPEAWEEAVVRCWREGIAVRTEYDRDSDPPSRDSTAMIVARHPFREPRIHRAFPGGLEELEIYRQEVIDGIHDDWINPAEGKWSYTYHQRLTAYPLPDGETMDQLATAVERLANVPHTRRAQAITWRVDLDPQVEDPPCLQRVWFRVFPGGDGAPDGLRMNVHMRSNDAFKAAFMNMWAFVDVQRDVAEALSETLGRDVAPEAYCHMVDSFHIYGSTFAEFEGFLRSTEQRTFEERVWRSDADFVRAAFDSARNAVAREKEDDKP